jgi:hypothetical protein
LGSSERVTLEEETMMESFRADPDANDAIYPQVYFDYSFKTDELNQRVNGKILDIRAQGGRIVEIKYTTAPYGTSGLAFTVAIIYLKRAEGAQDQASDR